MKKLLSVITLLILLSVTFNVCAESNAAATDDPDTLHIYFMNVGHGNCSIVIYNNHCVIIDCGGLDNPGNDIASFLNSKGVGYIDYIIITHPDTDHTNGFNKLLGDKMPFGAIYSSVDENDSHMGNIKKRIGDSHIIVPPSGTALNCDDVRFTLYHFPKLSSDNERSLVVKIEYLGHSILVMGDAEIKTEQAFLSGSFDLKSDVIVVGHHGSNTSSSLNFLKAVAPKYAVISGKKADLHEDTLQNLVQSHCAIWQTYLDGTIECTVNRNGLLVSSYNPYDSEPIFIVHRKSRVLHLPTCPNHPTTNGIPIYDISELTEDMSPHDTKRCLHGYSITDLMQGEYPSGN